MADSRRRTGRAVLRTALLVPVAVLSSVASSAVAASPAPSAGEKTVHVKYLRVFDIQGNLDDDTCADIFGTIKLVRGETEKVLWNHTKHNQVEVCEPNRPLVEGTQSGDMPLNLRASIPATQDKSGSSWKIVADLWDYDTFSPNDPVLRGGERVDLASGGEKYLQDDYPDGWIRASLTYEVR